MQPHLRAFIHRYWFRAFRDVSIPRKRLFAGLCGVLLLLAAVGLVAWMDQATLRLLHHRLYLMVQAGVALAVLAWQLRRHIMQPWLRIIQLMRLAQQDYALEYGEMRLRSMRPEEVARALTRFAEFARDAHAHAQLLQHELAEARQLIARYHLQQSTIISTTNRELIEQYRSVIAYAHYLDEHVTRCAPDAQLRYDFDDVCESGFNLKLIAQSLAMLRDLTPDPQPVPMAQLLQQTMLALAPTLERRAMKLSTLGFDEAMHASTDPAMISHVVWMVLLGAIRYAAAESTLRLRCLAVDDGANVMLSIVVSELEPGQLTPEERQAHLLRQLEHLNPHLFAETLRLHSNIQLSELLVAKLGGRIDIHPMSHYACEICLILPAAQKE